VTSDGDARARDRAAQVRPRGFEHPDARQIPTGATAPVGFDVGLTVDGPRGATVKPGRSEVARLTGAAIVPITVGSRRHRTLSSWDAFEVPAPGTRVVVRYAAPVVVPAQDRDAMEAHRVEFERALRITAGVDRGALCRALPVRGRLGRPRLRGGVALLLLAWLMNRDAFTRRRMRVDARGRWVVSVGALEWEERKTPMAMLLL
jgi:hypothetical protein